MNLYETIRTNLTGRDLEALKANRDECYDDYQYCEEQLNDPDLKGQERSELQNELSYLKRKYEDADKEYADALKRVDKQKDVKPVSAATMKDKSGTLTAVFQCDTCDKPFFIPVEELGDDFYKDHLGSCPDCGKVVAADDLTYIK